ncbi:cholesterol esterase [Streptomyces albus subsp. albus]|nr:cholesterol esterase [Streptomyces albus subsp. albus]
MESVARGGTRWKRFAVVMVPSVAATAAIGVALAQGALAASFAVSGQQFKVSAKRLDGEGFVQYGALDAQHGGRHIPVAVSAFKNAKIEGMCQSVVIPVPLFGDVSLQLHAGNNGKKVEAKNLYIDLEQLDADAVFRDINIGVSANDTTKGPGVKDKIVEGSFAQEADSATLTDVKQTAWATSAGTLKLSGLSLSVKAGKHECF